EVDAEVEQREAGVAPRVVGRVEGADDRRGVGLEPTAADPDTQQADDDAGEPGQDGQPDVPEHDQDGAVEQRPFTADQPVRDPGTQDGRQVDQTAVSADQTGRHALV